MEASHLSLRLKGILSFSYFLEVLAGKINVGWLIMACALLGLPGAAQAQFNYATNNSKIVITGYTGSDEAVVIPSTINGLTVATIRTSTFYGCSSVRSINIPSTVTSIGYGAFTGCSNLEFLIVSSLNTIYSSVDGVLMDKSQTTLLRCPEGKQGDYYIPSSVTSINENGFANCIGLNAITIPNSVSEIDDYAFSSCISLVSLTIPSSVTSLGYGVFYQCSGLTSISIPNSVSSLGNGAFSGCSSLSDIVIPNSITEIGTDTFSGCMSLQNIVIPSSVTSIGDYAFFGCTELVSITIPNSVTKIGYEAFYGCPSLVNITLPNKITAIGDNAFYGCSGLYSVTFPTTLVTIGNYAFAGCSNLTSIKIPYKVTTIGKYTFSDCTSLNSVTLSNKVTSIGDAAFAGCVSLPTIRLSTKLKAIGTNMFSGCVNLTKITLPSSVKTVGNYAFSGCVNLTNVTMSSGVRTIGNDAFADCVSLAYLKIPSSVKTIADAAFSGCVSLTNMTVPSSVKTIENSLFYGCTGLTNVTLSSSVKTIEGSAFGNCVNLKNITLPSSLKSIGDNAFFGCSNLYKIIIPTYVTSIEDSAFQNCSSLTNVTLSSNLTIVGDYTFAGCSSLASIVIPNKVTRIGNFAFAGCSNLVMVTMGTAVNSIGGGAFSDCINLAYVTLPKTVTSLGYEAFANCPALKSVFFEGNIPSSVDDSIFLNSANALVYYRTNATGWGTLLGGVAANALTTPMIYQSPTNQFVLPGGTAVFTVGAFGPLPITYQWQMNGTNLSGAVNSTYTIKSVQSWNAGVYSVVVSSKYGSTTSSNARLSVRPTVVISTPKSGLSVSNAVLKVLGTTTGNMNTGLVYCRVNDGEWVTAQGSTSWTASLSLTPGINWLQAKAVDSEGNDSAVASNKVTYVKTAYLTVEVDGSGSVSGTLATKTSNTALMAVGKAVSLKAVGGTGNAFLGWSGWTNSGSPTLSFVMPSTDAGLTANFITSPFPSAAGKYRGLIGGENAFDSTRSGGFYVTVTSGGAYSAKLVFASQSVSGSGALTFVDNQTNVVMGIFTNRITGTSTRVAFTIILDTGTVTGSLTTLGTAESAFASLEGNRVSNTNLGVFNISLARQEGTNGPSGFGYGSVTFSSSSAKITLALPDEKATVTALATDRLNNGLIPIFTPLYGTGGFLTGWLIQSNQQIVASSLVWHKKQGASATFYNDGFDQWYEAQGGLYTTTTSLSSWGTGSLKIDGEIVSSATVGFQSATLTKSALSIPVNDGTHSPAPFTVTVTTGKVSLYGAGVSGTGILIPSTAPVPGIYGFVTNKVDGVGIAHSVLALPETE